MRQPLITKRFYKLSQNTITRFGTMGHLNCLNRLEALHLNYGILPRISFRTSFATKPQAYPLQ